MGGDAGQRKSGAVVLGFGGDIPAAAVGVEEASRTFWPNLRCSGGSIWNTFSSLSIGNFPELRVGANLLAKGAAIRRQRKRKAALCYKAWWFQHSLGFNKILV